VVGGLIVRYGTSRASVIGGSANKIMAAGNCANLIEFLQLVGKLKVTSLQFFIDT
jgi:hypothetical protein